jgi:hypothetical protein
VVLFKDLKYLVLLFALCLVFGPGQVLAAELKDCSRLNMRANATGQANVKQVLDCRNDKVEVVGKYRNWIKVNVNGQTGWVYHKYVDLESSAPTPQASTVGPPAAVPATPVPPALTDISNQMLMMNAPATFLPNRSGADPVTFKNGDGKEYRVKVLEQRGGMFLTKVYKNGIELPGTYLISKKWAFRSLNFDAAEYAAKINEAVRRDTSDPASVRANEFCDPVEKPEPPPLIVEDLREDPEFQQPESPSADSCFALDVASLPDGSEGKLTECFGSIKERLTEGARRDDGTLDRDKLFCNLYGKLSPKEQEFAALMLTSISETGVIVGSRNTESPKFQESMFVMQVIQNRTRAAGEQYPGRGFNQLDVMLSRSQFSGFNRRIFYRDKHWQMFEPNNPIYNNHVRQSVRAFIALKSTPEKLQPRPQVEMIDSYFNPWGMRPRGSSPLWAKPGNGNQMITGLNFDGVKVRKTKPFMHKFYTPKPPRKIKPMNPNHTLNQWRSREACAEK